VIRDEARRVDLPDFIALGIAGAETNWDPTAVGDSGHSYGLFQLYVNGGQGDSWAGDPELLKNPRLNSRLAMPPIRDAYRWWEAKGYRGVDLIGLTAVYSGHPGRVPLSDPRVRRIVRITLELVFEEDGSYARWPDFHRSDCADIVMPDVGALPPAGALADWEDLDPVAPPPVPMSVVSELPPVAPPPALS